MSNTFASKTWELNVVFLTSVCYSLEIESQLSVREVEKNPPLRITWCLSKGHNNWNESGAWEETQWAIKTIQSNRVWCLLLLTGISLSESLHNPNQNNITTFDHVTHMIIRNIWRIKPAQKFQCYCEKKSITSTMLKASQWDREAQLIVSP